MMIKGLNATSHIGVGLRTSLISKNILSKSSVLSISSVSSIIPERTNGSKMQQRYFSNSNRCRISFEGPTSRRITSTGGILGGLSDSSKLMIGLFGVAGLISAVSLPVLIVYSPIILATYWGVRRWRKNKDDHNRYTVTTHLSKLRIPATAELDEDLSYEFTRTVLENAFINNELNIREALKVKLHDDELDAKLGHLEDFASFYYKEASVNPELSDEMVTTIRQIRILKMPILRKHKVNDRTGTAILTVVSTPIIDRKLRYDQPFHAIVEVIPAGLFSKRIVYLEMPGGGDNIYVSGKNKKPEIEIMVDAYTTTTNNEK